MPDVPKMDGHRLPEWTLHSLYTLVTKQGGALSTLTSRVLRGCSAQYSRFPDRRLFVWASHTKGDADPIYREGAQSLGKPKRQAG